MNLTDLTGRDDAALDYQKLVFDYTRSTDQDAAEAVRHRVVVVGSGAVGVALAIDLAQRCIPVVLLRASAQETAFGVRSITVLKILPAKKNSLSGERLSC